MLRSRVRDRQLRQARSDRGGWFRRRLRPCVEPLENYLLLTTFLVTNNNDSGPGSLRNAINLVNGDPVRSLNRVSDLDDIAFQIPPSAPYSPVIRPIEPEPPVLRRDVLIHEVFTVGVTLDGSICHAGLTLAGDGDEIDGLTFINCDAAVVLAGNNNILIGNIIRNNPGDGVDITGNGAFLNQVFITYNGGIGINDSGDNGVLLADTITNNGGAGVVLAGNGNSITGSTVTSNGGDGVAVSGNGNSVGLPVPVNPIGIDDGGNWISGNGNNGVSFFGGASRNVLEDNLIGTDGSGLAAFPNHWSGVSFDDASNNLVGGMAPGVSNVISGNGNNGITIIGSGSVGEAVQGNRIGTDFSGRYALGNAWSGISISGPYALIGGTVPAASNTISANGGDGVWIGGPSATGISVDGDNIGTDITGEVALGNAWGGVVIAQGASGNTLSGNLISGNSAADGVVMTDAGTSKNFVVGNRIGTDATGAERLGNGRNGVVIIYGATDNTVGGTDLASRNFISANGWDGVALDAPSTTGNVVLGNFIGTDNSGMMPLGNTDRGVGIYGGASGNVVGGTAFAAGNTIADNGWEGVAIVGAPNNLVQGNRIGTDDTGLKPLGNHGNGIGIWAASTGNTIGGSAPGAGNLISGNGAVYNGSGVAITGAGTTGNAVQGNWIGTDPTGSVALGNHDAGVAIWGNATGNFIGGSGSSEGNVISANGSVGVSISWSASDNVVQGNMIGTDASGGLPLGNGTGGIDMWGNADANVIGGSSPGAGNVISANGGVGVSIEWSASDNVVQGNKIGTDLSGNAPLGNALEGMLFYEGAARNLVGGETPGDENVIADNGGDGIRITDQGTSGNVVRRNLIGTDATGTLPLGNHQNGVEIQYGASGNVIGDTNPAGVNIISANLGSGVAIDGGGTSGNVVEGDKIGTDISGTQALGNAADGVAISGGATSNFIGLPNPSAKNVISGNFLRGVSIADVGTSKNVVACNFIGTDFNGALALGNLQGGLAIFGGASLNLVGVTDEGGGNIISGNGFAGANGSYSGVSIAGDQSDGNVVQHNIIGLAAGGESPLPNARDGVDVSGGADANVIGGAEHHTENLISGNAGAGVVISDFATNRNVIQGDLIGTDLSGNAAIPNGSDGVQLVNTHSNVVGGGTSPESRNVIAGNLGSGVNIIGSAANTVAGNSIGVGLGGWALGNQGDGMRITASSSFNMIGGTDPTAANLIAYNGGNGVTVGADTTDESIGNSILENSIVSNGKLGIDLGNDGPTPNTPGGPHSGANLLQNHPVIASAVSSASSTLVTGSLNSTPGMTFQLEFFANPTANASGYGEGKTYLGTTSVTTDASGNASIVFTAPTSVTPGYFISSTATDSADNTSEFSLDRVVTANLPPTLAAIPDQTMAPYPAALSVTLNGGDADGDPLAYSATARTLPSWLKSTFGLYQDPGGYFTSYRGQGEKYLRGTASASGYNDSGGYWYYILPNGDLYEFTPPYSNPVLTGTLVAHLGTAIYDDPSLLWNASNVAVSATLTVSTNTLAVAPNAGYTGTFVVIATVSDGQATASRSFKVAVAAANQSPTLAPIPDQTITSSMAVVILLGSDPNGLSLTYSATTETLPYWLKSTFGLYQDPGGYFTSYRGQGEKYLRGTSSASGYSDPSGYWYYILPNGDLYEFTPSYSNPVLTGALVAHLGMAAYNDPSILWNATNTSVPAALSVSGNVLTITPNAGFTGSFVVIATVSNGGMMASRSFKVTVV
jgi:hypothetical protein